MSEELDFQAILTDSMTAALDVIIAGLEQIAETASQAAEALSAAFSEASVEADAAAASTDALAGSMDAATAATDANTAATDANAAAQKAAKDAREALATSAKAMIMPLGIATAAVAAIGVASVVMAGNFQEGVDTIQTGAGELPQNMGIVAAGIKNISEQTGESTDQLIQGMFQIESAGIRGQAAVVALGDAARAAAVGGAALSDVANAQTTLMQDFADQHLSAAAAVNILTATVQNGKTTLAQLAPSLSSVASTAAAAHVRVTDMMGALATMTSEGVPAANATTYLRQMITALQAPSAQTAKALKDIGLNANAVAAGMQTSLPQTLATITEALRTKFPDATAIVQREMAKVNDGTETFDQALQNLSNSGAASYVAAVKEIAGGSKQMQGILDLTGTHMGTFATAAQKISGAVKAGGNSVVGWSVVQASFNNTMARGWATLKIALINLGEVIFPVIQQLATGFQPVLEWLGAHSQVVAVGLGVLAVVIGGALVGALVAAATALEAADFAALPFIAIGAGIALAVVGLAAAFILAYTHITPFREAIQHLGTALSEAWTWIQQLGATIGRDLGPTFTQLGQTLKSELLPAWQSLQSAFVTLEPVLKVLGIAIGGVLVTAVGLLIGIFSGLVEAFATVLAGVVEFAGGLIQAFTGVVKLIVDLWSGFFTILSDIFSGHWSKLGADAHAWGMALWHDLIQIVTGLTNAVMGLFQVFVGGTLAFVKGFVTGVVAFFGDLFDKLVGHSIVPDLINAIIGWFEQLPQRAVAWGKNLIQNFINGITAMTGGLKNAVSGVASTIGKFLGFHSPAEEGPGATADEWMPNLIKMLATGLTQHAPLLGAAAQSAAGQIAGVLGAPSGGALGSGGFPASALATGAGVGGVGGPTQITVVLKDDTGMGFLAGARMLDPHVMTMFAQQIAREMQQQGLLQGRQPIGYTGSK